jgi:streptomycin 6-kinase
VGGLLSNGGVGQLEIPQLVRERASNNGAAGQRWLADLPELVAELAGRWQLELGEAFTGGSASYVVAATDATGRACVLKIGMPLDMHERDDFARSVRVHELAGGRGCVALLDHDEAASAMLLERLGPNLHALGLELPDVLDAIATTLSTFWRPVPDGLDLPTMRDQAEWLARYIETTWHEVGRPGERAVIDRALALCEAGAARFDSGSAVLVHGDAHGWNTLAAGDGAYKFVDPEGLCAEREYDLSVAMREYNGPLLVGDTPRLVRERAEFLAERCGVDAQTVWDWGFVERVSTGLANVRDFDNDDGLAFLEVARRSL